MDLRPHPDKANKTLVTIESEDELRAIGSLSWTCSFPQNLAVTFGFREAPSDLPMAIAVTKEQLMGRMSTLSLLIMRGGSKSPTADRAVLDQIVTYFQDQHDTLAVGPPERTADEPQPTT